MILSGHLKKQNILVKAKAHDRWDLMEELVDLGVKNGEIDPSDREELLNALIEREKSMSTGIGNGVAIPHCITQKATDLIVLMAVSQKGIDFDSIDGLPVKIAILLIVPKTKLTQHIKALANIARLMNDDALRADIVSAKDAAAIIEEIAACEAK